MTSPVSIVIPTLGDRELLAACLNALTVESGRRGSIDEILVIDDTGERRLVAWLSETFPDVSCHANSTNVGFGRALLAGVELAQHEFVLSLNPDVSVLPGCLDPLVETLFRPDVRAVSPYILLDGETRAAESLPELRERGGFLHLAHQDLEIEPGVRSPAHPDGVPVAFALGGAFLFRKREFLAQPFDRRFEPFYWEDVDWCQRVIAEGGRVLCDPRAVVEHHHRGTISSRVPENLRRAAIEKNRLLFTWKHVCEPAARKKHFEALSARLLEQGLAEDREELIWLLLALEESSEC